MTATKEAAPEAASTRSEVEHLDGCPADRIERYDQTRPDGWALIVTRCLDCGAQRVDPADGRFTRQKEHTDG